jgi:hypothetical protein
MFGKYKMVLFYDPLKTGLKESLELSTLTGIFAPSTAINKTVTNEKYVFTFNSDSHLGIDQLQQ